MANSKAETAKAMVLAALVADALALGVHWDYQPQRILEQHGRVGGFITPTTMYHTGKQAGEFTHYGDQTLVLLQSVAACKGFAPAHFMEQWQTLFADYSGYVDGATRNTLKNIADGAAPTAAGSDSSDLAGAARIAPLACALLDQPEAYIAAAKEQTLLTHNNPDVGKAAEFLARATLECANGAKPIQGMQSAAGQMDDETIAEWLESGLDFQEEDVTGATQKLGPSCSVGEAFPAMVQCVAHNESDLKTCLVDCVMAGGDSAARAMPAAMILAASPVGGMPAIPREWIDALVHNEAIRKALAAFE